MVFLDLAVPLFHDFGFFEFISLFSTDPAVPNT